jgi:hypothetical protein
LLKKEEKYTNTSQINHHLQLHHPSKNNQFAILGLNFLLLWLLTYISYVFSLGEGTTWPLPFICFLLLEEKHMKNIWYDVRLLNIADTQQPPKMAA